MLSLLSGLSSKVYLVVIAALAALLFSAGIYSYFLSSENDDLKSDLKSYEIALDQTVKISNENNKEFEKYKQQNELIISTLNKEHKRELKRYKTFANKKGEIKNVKKSDDGVNANIINNTLDWLHKETINSNTDKNSKSESTK